MFFKKTVFFVWMVLAVSCIFSQTATLDEAISISAYELGQRLNKGGKVAVLNFKSGSPRLSSYVIEEMDNAIVRDNIITVVDRRELNLVRQEQKFQMSDEVSEESAQRIGQFLGASTVVSGSFEVIGNTYRFRIRAIGVETGSVQYSNSLSIQKDDVLSALTKVEKAPRAPRHSSTEYSVSPALGIDVGGFVNGGTMGWVMMTAGGEVGINLQSSKNLYLNIWAEVGGELGLSYLSYYYGGRIELRSLEYFLIGIGGGMQGGSDGEYSPFPYIRGTLAFVVSSSDGMSIKAYYDYGFENHFRVGLLFNMFAIFD
jgi:TolB-like protein